LQRRKEESHALSVLTLEKFVEKSWQSRNSKAVASTATSTRGKLLQRKCACGGQAGQSENDCEDCKKKKTLQRQAAGPAAQPPAPPIVHEVLKSPGQPLDPATRNFFELRFGHDFSRVRVHTDDRAASSARAVNAAAYTVGNDVVFDSNHRPADGKSRQLVAHELAHVVQQETSIPSLNGDPGSLRVAPSDDGAEHEAEKAAKNLGSVSPSAHEPPAVRRAPPDAGTKQAQPTQTQPSPYTQALTQIQTLDPVMYGYLSKATLNGASTAVRVQNATDNSTTPPTQIQITFNLVVKEAVLPANVDAAFNGGVPVIGGQGTSRTFTANMEMSVSKTASTALAENLFHEGIHMLLFMDDLLPGGSPHGAALTNYKKIAAASPDFGPMNSQLATMLATKLKLTQAQGQKQAGDLVNDVIEEKYVRDQEAAKFHAPFTNRALASTYILKDLNDVGISVPITDIAFQSIAQAAARIMDDIDQKVKAAQPSTPLPAQKQPAQTPQGTKKP
jgi:hypothetical protein